MRPTGQPAAGAGLSAVDMTVSKPRWPGPGPVVCTGPARSAHRPSSAQEQIYTQLGIDALAWGENIAWAAGYGPEEVARIHFEGWRESDAGHYCSLITRRFTRIGIGEIRVEGESWAVQNFFHPQTAPILVASD